ncbi:hypothetical protein VaNZ11_016423, partial [Volvox africanus]
WREQEEEEDRVADLHGPDTFGADDGGDDGGGGGRVGAKGGHRLRLLRGSVGPSYASASASANNPRSGSFRALPSPRALLERVRSLNDGRLVEKFDEFDRRVSRVLIHPDARRESELTSHASFRVDLAARQHGGLGAVGSASGSHERPQTLSPLLSPSPSRAIIASVLPATTIDVAAVAAGVAAGSNEPQHQQVQVDDGSGSSGSGSGGNGGRWVVVHQPVAHSEDNGSSNKGEGSQQIRMG